MKYQDVLGLDKANNAATYLTTVILLLESCYLKSKHLWDLDQALALFTSIVMSALATLTIFWGGVKLREKQQDKRYVIIVNIALGSVTIVSTGVSFLPASPTTRYLCGVVLIMQGCTQFLLGSILLFDKLNGKIAPINYLKTSGEITYFFASCILSMIQSADNMVPGPNQKTAEEMEGIQERMARVLFCSQLTVIASIEIVAVGWVKKQLLK